MLTRMPTPLASWLALLLASTFAHGQTIAGPLRLSVSCSSVTIAQGLTAQCAAKESFFRGSAQAKDVTESVVWSSDSSAALISNTPGSKGMLTANSPGPAIITASSGPLRASVQVTITPPELAEQPVSQGQLEAQAAGRDHGTGERGVEFVGGERGRH